MLIVAALGRSALAAADAIGLEDRIGEIARGLAPIAREHRLVVFHSGAALDPALGVHAHLLGRELQNALPGMSVASLVGHCVVSRNAGGRLAELDLLRRLLEDPGTVPCVGGVPVRLDANGEMIAAGPAFDADQAAASLATELGADVLLFLADVDAVYRDWPARHAPIGRLDADDPETVSAGMAAKVEAACRFARLRGTFAVIGRADRGAALLAGGSGTCVAHPD